MLKGDCQPRFMCVTSRNRQPASFPWQEWTCSTSVSAPRPRARLRVPSRGALHWAALCFHRSSGFSFLRPHLGAPPVKGRSCFWAVRPHSVAQIPAGELGTGSKAAAWLTKLNTHHPELPQLGS